jgi:hypothetical protein
MNLKHPITNNNMFDYVYPTTNNKREIVVSIENISDSETYVHKLKGEVGKLMTTIKLANQFLSMSEINKLILQEPWQPFARGEMIKIKEITNNGNRNWTKRLQIEPNKTKTSN